MNLINKFITRALVAIFLTAFFILPINAEQFYVGNTVYNVCTRLPLFKAPDRDATVIRVMARGESAYVASVHGKYDLPDSDPSSEASQRARLPDRNEDDMLLESLFRRINWAGFAEGGFASASCLVKKELFLRQTPALANEKVAMLSGAGKRGFSEDEEGDLVGMRGAAGKAKKRTNSESSNVSIDDYLGMYFAQYEFTDNTEFRRQGGLGEFKQ